MRVIALLVLFLIYAHPANAYRWCKVGENSTTNDCVDGSGSGG
jgi:hypothetical protein